MAVRVDRPVIAASPPPSSPSLDSRSLSPCKAVLATASSRLSATWRTAQIHVAQQQHKLSVILI
ncbi:hypothetical protein BSLA_02f2130 [Burkholderia stabilis]|nr:hypothetical protein BSLA_02f2130 [Burkholderia stabilis]